MEALFRVAFCLNASSALFRAGRLTGVTDPTAGSWRFAYDALGRVTRRSDPFGTAEETKFAREGYVDTVTLRGASGVLDVFDYGGYDALGNPHTIDTNEGRTDIAYDARDRVTNVTYPLVGGTRASETFAYDRVGNRTLHVDRTGVSRTYQFDDAYQLNAIVSTSNPSQILDQFEYDAAGRRTAHYSGGTLAHSYAYNAASELVEVATGSAIVSIGYGPDGARYRSTDATGTDYFFGASLEYRDGHPVRVVRAGDQVLAEIASTATRGFAYDASQNLTHEIFGGAITATARYEAFGATRVTNGSVTTLRGFASAMRESTTGLIAMGARHYDPATGTFLQTDPLYLTTNQLYAYANNNPYAYWDPSGLSSQSYNISSGSNTGSLSYSSPALSPSYTSSGSYSPSRVSTSSGSSTTLYNPDPLGPNPGTYIKFEVLGFDVVPLGGFEFASGLYFGRNQAGNFQAGPYIEKGPAVGVGFSVDAGFDYVKNVPELDRSLSINIGVGAGPLNVQFNLDPTDPSRGEDARFRGGFNNGWGASGSYGMPVEAVFSLTTTRAFDLIGFGRGLFSQ